MTPTLQTPAATSSDLKQAIAAQLERIRARTLDLIEQLSDDALNRVHDPLLSPIAWDLGHIANFEELWLVQRVGGGSALQDSLGRVYDPFTAPRRERGELPYLRGEECLSYMRAVRERTLACLEQADLSDGGGRLLSGGFVYDLIARHEQQHSETILQTLQAMTSEPYQPEPTPLPPSPPEIDETMVPVAGGPFEMGAGHSWFAYDNERAAHVVELAPFWLDRRPVSNGELAQFIEDGGYERREWWSVEGWRWRESEGVTMPRYWQQDGGGYTVRSFGRLAPIDPALPICHVSWYEADAYARYAGKRLPTEAEWEKAASWNADGGPKRRYPWGSDAFARSRANLDQLGFGTAPVGAYPSGASAARAEQMAGDVWEWTGSGFDAYPGFEPFPYPEYSEPFFGGPFKVLRGGSWATQPDAVSSTFRNWDHPDRRQIFAGFRCARDAEPDENRTRREVHS